MYGGQRDKYLQNKFKDNKYALSILSPFTTKAVRGPNDFCQPTCLYEYKFVVDAIGGNTNL